MDFSGGLVSKESAWNAGDLNSIPGSGRSPGEGNGYPLQYSCLENPMDRGAWWATVHRVAKNQTQLNSYTWHTGKALWDQASAYSSSFSCTFSQNVVSALVFFSATSSNELNSLPLQSFPISFSLSLEDDVPCLFLAESIHSLGSWFLREAFYHPLI